MNISTEQKVGFFFLAALIVLAIMIELVQDWRPFEDEYAYHAYFQSTIGLKEGDPVRIAGVEVGKVDEIGLEDAMVRVDFHVNLADVITDGSTAQVRQTNLLGGIFLGLEFGAPGSPLLPPGSEVTSREAANIDQLINNLDKNQERLLKPLGDLVEKSGDSLADTIRRFEKIATKVDEGEGTLGRLINDPALFEELTQASRRLNSMLAKMEDSEGTLGKLMSDPSLYENLDKTMVNMTELTDQLRSGQGTLGRLFVDETLYTEATATMTNLHTITDRINRGEGALGKLLNDDELYTNVNESMVRIRSIATKIDEGQGSLGKLVNDDELYRDAKTTLHKAEKTVDGLSDTGPLSALGVVLGTLF